jgi:hypothetical protein
MTHHEEVLEPIQRLSTSLQQASPVAWERLFAVQHASHQHHMRLRELWNTRSFDTVALPRSRRSVRIP